MLNYQGAYHDYLENRTGPIPQGIYEQSEASLGQIGTVRRVGGRTFVYAKDSGTGLAQGKLNIQPTAVPNHQNVVAQAIAPVGVKEVAVTLGATLTSRNQYEDGYLFITDADGEGTGYKIRSNPAAALSTTLTLTLYDAIHEALAVTSECCLIPNPYNGVLLSIADQLDTPAGVALNAITANYYFWIQTGGPCAVLADETIAQGLEVTIGSSTVGAVEGLDGAGEPLVGIAIIAGVNEEYRPIFLKILE